MFTKMVLSIMKKTKFFLERWGLHSFFLLLFFVLHNYNQYYGMVSAKVAFSVFLQILLIFSVCFLLLFFFYEGVTLLSSSTFFLKKNLLTTNTDLKLNSLPAPSARPDVYYLVFDCYPGNSFLRDYMQFDNSLFNAALKEKGFHIIENPKSNYNRTALSISSTLNFEYLKGIRSFSSISSKDYSQAKLTIKESI